MTYRLCLFDFDGTIADTIEEARHILNRLADEYGFGRVEPEDVADLRNLSSKQLFKALGIKKRWLPMLLAKGTKQLRATVKDLPLIDGMDGAIKTINANTEVCGILTSNSVENVELFLEAQGMKGQFEFISSVSKLSGKHKHMRSIMRTFSLKPTEVLYVGDEIRDVKAAHRAGVNVAAVTWGFNSREALLDAGPTFLIEDVPQLLDLLGLGQESDS